ncbi:uncharacterized protein LOC111643843, partial [Copidosoma floridanum]|uniref:uncharacterized protein LOC111643843 n=1 Tax=Copidosoma floridanum TaxID=29053 RepID=UPI000C6FCA16
MCDLDSPWPDRLPLVLLGLRTAFKEDLQASSAEMLYGTALRVPGDFFSTTSQPGTSPASFAEKLRSFAQSVKAVPASRHIPDRTPFFFKDLRTCTHVFKRVDSIRKPLQPPYSGPHRIIRRTDERTYVIDVNGKPHTVSTDALKPAYLDAKDASTPSTKTAPPSPTASSPSPADSPEVPPTRQPPSADPSTAPEPALSTKTKKR